MMINKRLIGMVSESKRYIAANVALQWCGLVANIALMAAVSRLIGSLAGQSARASDFIQTALIGFAALLIRVLTTTGSARMSYLSSKAVKKTLREKIYRKLLRLGISYREQMQTAEIVQAAVEGVEQLETYFGSYLPQFFYAMLAPITLFAVLSFVSLPAAISLLICVPLIPVAIVAVQRWAKKLLSRYWDQYTAMGDSFLENLQGLTTLKIYQADDLRQQQMHEEAEKFRKITMKVLTMQLNSVTIMDLIAYGGAALGVILASLQYRSGATTLSGSLLIILLAADFFLPMRLLGSFFHIAMNGMAASEKIFHLLDLPEPENSGKPLPETGGIRMEIVRFGYQKEREILSGIDLTLQEGTLTALVGESGCGKSTIARILMKQSRDYTGSITIGGCQLREIAETALLQGVTYISHQSYLFKGTVRENLQMGRENADDATLWAVLEQTQLADFLRSEQGLDTLLTEKAANLSGGQRQRLALARALLRDSRIYIFDEATSNIDVESEELIVRQIYTLAAHKTVLMISHRLANVTGAGKIYLLENGHVTESGSHSQLLATGGCYARLWNTQQILEQSGKDECK